MLNQYLSKPVLQVLSKDPYYADCCERLTEMSDKNEAHEIIKDALKQAMHINEIIPLVLEYISDYYDHGKDL